MQQPLATVHQQCCHHCQDASLTVAQCNAECSLQLCHPPGCTVTCHGNSRVDDASEPPQVLGKYDGVAINDSVHIDSSVDELVAVFDEKSEMVYQVGIDLAPAVTWKAPYRDISVRRRSLFASTHDVPTAGACWGPVGALRC